MSPHTLAVWESIPWERVHCLPSQQPMWSLSLSHISPFVLIPLSLLKNRSQYDMFNLHFVVYRMDRFSPTIWIQWKPSQISPSRSIWVKKDRHVQTGSLLVKYWVKTLWWIFFNGKIYIFFLHNIVFPLPLKYWIKKQRHSFH